MGSLSECELSMIKHNFKRRYNEIVKRDWKNFIRGMWPKNTFTTFIDLESNYCGISYTLLVDIKPCIGILHFIIHEWDSIEHFRNEIISILEPELSRKITILQRRWREYYYSPDGPFLKKNAEKMADKYGILP